MNFDEIERAALGRKAKLGDLYDQYNDRFTGQSSLLQPEIVESLKTSSKIDSVHETYSGVDEKLSSLAKHLKIPPDQIYGLLFDRHEKDLFGFETVVIRSTSTATFVKGIVIVSEYAFEEKIDCASGKWKVKDHVGADLSQGTHVVCGITWGGHLVVTFTCGIVDVNERESTSRNMSRLVKDVQTRMSNGTPLNPEEIERHGRLFNHLSVHVGGDADTKAAIDNLNDLSRNVPTLVQRLVHRPKPTKYTLYPVLKISTRRSSELDVRSFFPLLRYQIFEVEEYFTLLNGIVSEFEAYVELVKRKRLNSPDIQQMISNNERAKSLVRKQRELLKTAISEHRNGVSYFFQWGWKKIVQTLTLEELLRVLKRPR